MITLTTDIGFEYAAQIKGVILSLNPNVKIIDISHSIQPQNIKHGAYVLYSTISHFPYAIHIAVVDPGVGTKRRGIIIDCEKGVLIGPDNGLLIPAAEILEIKNVYDLTYIKNDVSNKFHGRDIFAPIAAKISLGENIENFGKIINDYKKLSFRNGKKIDNKIVGKIIFIDNFGNLIINISKKSILDSLKFGHKYEIKINNKSYNIKFLKSYGFAYKGEMLSTISSSNLFEISCNMGNAFQKINANVDDKVIICLK